jgi:hypothetical protein
LLLPIDIAGDEVPARSIGLMWQKKAIREFRRRIQRACSGRAIRQASIHPAAFVCASTRSTIAGASPT